MKEDYVEQWKPVDEEEDFRPREQAVVGRMRWDSKSMSGVPMSDGNNQTLLQSTLADKEWLEETEAQRKCGWWTADNPHPFRKDDDKVCVLCGARRV